MTTYDCLALGLGLLLLIRDKRPPPPPLGFPVEPFTQNPLLFLSQERRCTSLLLQASQKRDLTQDGGGLPVHPAEVGRALSVLVSCSQRIRFPFSWVLKDRALQLLSSQRKIFTSSETRAQVYMGALFLRSGNHQSCLPFSPSISATEAVLRGPLNSSVSHGYAAATCREEPCERLGPWPCVWNPRFCKLM